MATQSSSYFRTTHTALAAWLESLGFDYIFIELDSHGRAVFVFSNDDENLSKATKNFELGVAIGNVRTFYNSYRRLIKLVRNLNGN